MNEHASTTDLGTFITTGTRTTTPPAFTITIRRSLDLPPDNAAEWTTTSDDVVLDIQADLVTAEGARVLGEAFADLRRHYLTNELRLVQGGRAGVAS